MLIAISYHRTNMDPLRELQNSKKSFMRVNRQRNSSAQRKKRTVLSCTPCRQRKVKCDRLAPCTQCTQRDAAEACDFSYPSRLESALESATTVSPVQSVSPAPEPEDDHTSVSSPVRPALIHAQSNGHLPTGLTAPCNHTISSGPGQDLGSVNSLTQSCFHGSGTRTRFFGRSHWALTMDMFPDLKAHLQKYHHVKKGPAHSHDHQGMRHAKQRRLQTTYQTNTQANSQQQGLESLVPSRQVTDKLVDLYFSTFETTFRILHVPKFLVEYEDFWNSKDRSAESANAWSRDVFTAKLLSLLICAVSLADPKLLKDPQSQISAQTAKDWLQAVGSWVKTVTTYAKLDLDFIQVMCLLLIARQAIAYEGDLAWLAAGSLIREAMMIGLHRDPSNFKGISPFHAEIRRRLWFTIVQLDLQAALDTGVPASISEEDFDCAVPSNLDDEDFSTDSTVLPASKDATVLTRTSFQVLLAQTLSVQIKIVKIVNQIRLSSTYQDILDLSNVITNDFAQSPLLASLKQNAGHAPSDFRISLYLFLIYRYLLALHRPFVLSLSETPTEMYAYSRRICVQACIALLAPVKTIEDSSTYTSPQVSLPLILRLRGGMFRSELFHAAATLCFELRLQTKDSILPPLPSSDPDISNQGQRKSLMRNVEAAINYFSFKVRTEKQACKAFMLLNMAYVSAQSELLGKKQKGDLTLESACPRAARRCQELLLEGGEGRAECQHSEENWLGYPGNPLMNEEVPELRGHRHSPEATEHGSDPIVDADPDLFDLSFDWGMYLDPSYLDESGNLWPLMDPLI